ncbi:unnamed protein product [Didymodactylos carnosus]|uniref:Uncharacterized protein n=1 Tax=Didymodactylos carnosus TaxID=1234261 RepID=A0A814CRZ2_9BILA|nr:unnamed protein product [Didymodactylos carnosus]CAF3723293.1 unnamed protein product [Didymodactylos carnosus]
MFEGNNLTTEQDIPSKTGSVNKDKDSQEEKQQQEPSSTVSNNNNKTNECGKDSTSDEEESEENNDILNEKTLYAQTKGDEDFDTFILNNFKPFDGNQNVMTWLNETEQKI